MTKQATGALSKVCIGFEGSFNTVATTGFNMPFNSSSVKGSRNQNAPATMRGNLNPVEPDDGNTAVAGQIVVPVDSLAFWYWLKAMFGAPATTGAVSPYAHEFKVDSDTDRPSITIEHQFLNLATPQYLAYTGCKITSWAMSTGGDGELVATLQIVGAQQKAISATTCFSVSLTNATFLRLKNRHAAMKEGGATISNLKTVDFTVNWNCDTDQYVIGGGGVLGDIPDSVMSIGGNVSALFQNVTLLNKALNSTESSIQATYTGSVSSILDVLMPEVKYTLDSPSIEGPKGIAVNLPFQAYYDNDAEESAVVVTLTNTEAHA